MRLYEVVSNDIKAFASSLEAKYDLSSLWLYSLNDDTIKLSSIIVKRDTRKQDCSLIKFPVVVLLEYE